jgi:hypothetical protein
LGTININHGVEVCNLAATAERKIVMYKIQIRSVLQTFLELFLIRKRLNKGSNVGIQTKVWWHRVSPDWREINIHRSAIFCDTEMTQT